MNLILIGFRGAGKTTVGKILARRTGREFIDTDELIERRIGLTIQEIVAQKGWTFFRGLERTVISEVANTDSNCSRRRICTRRGKCQGF